MEIDKKKLILCLVAGTIVFIGLIIFMTLAFRAQTQKKGDEIQHTTESTVHAPEKIRIDGVENLFFLPQDQRSGFVSFFAEYLEQNSIEHNGVAMQVGNVDSKLENTVYEYHIYIPVNEVYILGKHYINTGYTEYKVEKNEEELSELNSAPCNPGNIDYQEAPEVEEIPMPVIIMNESTLTGSLNPEQIVALKAQLESFLMKDYEFRREVVVKDGTRVKDGDNLSFLMDFGVVRLDKKGVQVKYANGEFSFAFVAV